MPRLTRFLALCAAFAVCSPALAVETLQQIDAEVVREVAEPADAHAIDDSRASHSEPEPAAESSSVSGIAAAGLEAGEPTAPAASQMRAASPGPVQRPGARWNAFLPGMVR